MVDNSELPVPGSHQTSPDTQTNWNGILGRIELTATDPVWINDINAYPDIRGKKVRLKVQIRNETGKKLSGILRLKANSFNSPDSHNVPEVSYNISLENQTTEIDIEYFIGDNMLLWDEYSPSLYRLYAKLSTTGAEKYISLKEITFAMREFSAKGTQFNINGRTVFLRGKTDCCVFPLTGYAPMDLKSWLEIFQIAKSYGSIITDSIHGVLLRHVSPQPTCWEFSFRLSFRTGVLFTSPVKRTTMKTHFITFTVKRGPS